MFDNCILCCSSRVPFQLRCPFKTDFSSRSKRGFVLPIHRFLAIHAISMHFLLSHSFFPTSKRERERSHFEWRIYPRIEFFFSLFLRDPWRKREEIEKPSHNNSGKTLQVKAYEKKKEKVHFLYYFRRTILKTLKKTVRPRQGEAKLLDWRFLLYTVWTV